jgi:hypothetical protein
MTQQAAAKAEGTFILQTIPVAYVNETQGLPSTTF